MRLDLDLANPRYTLLHRAGLAGLYMTLKQLDREKVKPPPELTFQWDITHSQRVVLEWVGSDRTVLDWLLHESFRITNEDLIELRGIDSRNMRVDSQVIVHLGMLGTFLQHTSTHKSKGTLTKSFDLDPDNPEAKPIVVSYKALSTYAHQEFAKSLCDDAGNFLTKPISVAGWLNPGAVVRHIAFSSSTSFEELPEDALVLLFAPVACYYYLLRSKLRDKRSQYALIIPEISNLEIYATYRTGHFRMAGYKDFFASGLGDAGLRFLTYEEAEKLVVGSNLPRCQVLTLGTVAWATQQKTRTDLCLVEATPKICANYQLSKDCFSDQVISAKDSSFVSSSFAREFVSENLARGKEWYLGLSEVVTSSDLFQKLMYERRGLYNMVKQAEYDERDRLFVETCHEAIKFTYGQIKKYTPPGDDLNARFSRATVRMRSELSRCKSADSFREFITDFWARAGRLPTLQSHWIELMGLVSSSDPKIWKKSRDLALLALASYRRGDSASTDEENIPDLEDIENSAIEAGIPLDDSF